MTTYIIKRLLLMIPTLIGISIVVFCILRAAPGDPLTLQASNESGTVAMDPKMRDAFKAMRERYGLDKPLPVAYGSYMWKVLHGDLGESIIEHRPVKDMILERCGLTIKLNLTSELMLYLFAIPLGLLAARNRFAPPLRRFVCDTGQGVMLLVLYSLPAILVGTLLITYLAHGGILEDWLIEHHHENWLWVIAPIGAVHSPQSDQLGYWAYLRDVGWHFVLPVLTLSLGGLAFMSKMARASLLENMRMDYVRTAYAKGLKERVVVYVHALRNSLLPLITMLPLIIPGMLGGSVIVESIFNLPGMGLLYWQAVTRRDYEMIQAEALVVATLVLLAVLLSDILYAVADPRVRYE